jgi:ferredoxin
VSFGDGRSATWCADDGTTLLDLAESYGVRVDASCRAGVCGTCATRVDGDTAYVLDPLVSTADGAVLICCAVPTGDVDLLPADTGPSATLRP